MNTVLCHVCYEREKYFLYNAAEVTRKRKFYTRLPLVSGITNFHEKGFKSVFNLENINKTRESKNECLFYISSYGIKRELGCEGKKSYINPTAVVSFTVNISRIF